MQSKLKEVIATCVLLGTLLAPGGARSDASAGDLVINGDFDTSDCAVQKCEYWDLSGSAKIIGGGKTASAGQALAFGGNENLGAARQTLQMQPGKYKLAFRFFKACTDQLHTLVVISVGPRILLTRIVEGASNCGWQKLTLQTYMEFKGDADLLLRVRTLEPGTNNDDFLIDSVELAAL
jgi:hypothetical protein